jgi:cobalamin synthase
VLVLLLQVACLAAMPAADGGRLPWPAPSLPPWPAGCALAGTALIALATNGAAMRAVQLAGRAAVGLLAAELLFRRPRRRLDGVNGGVMGAMGETATTGRCSPPPRSGADRQRASWAGVSPPSRSPSVSR